MSIYLTDEGGGIEVAEGGLFSRFNDVCVRQIRIPLLKSNNYSPVFSSSASEMFSKSLTNDSAILIERNYSSIYNQIDL